jgi:hypothetical protein
MSVWQSDSLRRVSRVLVHVALVLLALELFYLVVANSLLKSSLIKRGVAGADGMQLEYGSAFSWLPGRARVSDLSLRVEDYNVQFLLKIERAELDVGLDELLHKRFHVFHLRADGVSFFMRHKVREATGHGERLAAFPKIDGFADPPLFVGSPPPPIPDKDYDLWQLQIEDVVARAKELWFLEYRFRGDAEARGAFLIRPARLVKVQPAELKLFAGSLSLGSHTVARSVKGNISVSMPNMEVQKTEGAQVFHQISVQAQLQLAQSELDFMNAYREPDGPSVHGAATWSIRARAQRGVVEPGTLLVCDASALEVTFPGKTEPSVSLSGPTLASLAVTEAAQDQLSLSLSAARLGLSRLEKNGQVTSKLPSPTVETASFAAAIKPVDLSQPPRLASLRASIARAHVPNLFWLEPWLSSDGSLRVDGVGDASFEAACDEQQVCQVERARVDAVGARLALDDRASEPWSGTFSAEDVLVPWHNPKLAGRARLEISSAKALLPLVTSLPIKDAVSSALGLAQLHASFALSGTTADYRLQLLDARTGSLSARGRYRRQKEQGQGALLLSTSLMNVGVTLRDSDTSVSLLAADDWLSKHAEGR